MQNIFGALHGGAIAAVAEMVSIACARTVVAEDKDIFLGELCITYLSSAPINVGFFLLVPQLVLLFHVLCYLL